MSGQGVRRAGAPVLALLSLRLLLELALLAAYAVATARLVGGPLGWALGVLAAVAAAVVWGLLLSPRRPVHLPLAARVAVELLLFVLAGSLLTVSGLAGLGIGLVLVELLDLGLLQGPDRHAF